MPLERFQRRSHRRALAIEHAAARVAALVDSVPSTGATAAWYVANASKDALMLGMGRRVREKTGGGARVNRPIDA